MIKHIISMRNPRVYAIYRQLALVLVPVYFIKHSVSCYIYYLFPCLQLNYEYLRKCVASGPVTPMPAHVWINILGKLSSSLATSTLTAPLLSQLHRWVEYQYSTYIIICCLCREVKGDYEETIRKTTIRMTLLKPSLRGMEHHESALCREPE